jgi:hypothetical protein
VLVVNAANLVVKNSKINGRVWMDQDVDNGSSGHHSVSLTDTEVDSGYGDYPTICCGRYTLLRVNAHGGHNAAQCENNDTYCTITDSWLHGQLDGKSLGSNGWHLGGFLSDGSDNITLKHNTVACDHVAEGDGGCTGDINLIPNFAPVHGAQIDSNLMVANIDSAFCTYGGEKSTSQYPHSDHVVYSNNVFQRGTNSNCADYGPVTSFNVNGTGNQWTNNVWQNGGTVAPAN